jgi:hypothetical protein
MQQWTDSRDFWARVAFRATSVPVLLLFLLASPLVLRPRLWIPSVVALSMAIGTTLLVAGIGFIWLRRWAPILMCGLAGYVLAIGGLGTTEEVALLVALILFILLPPTLVSWRTLVWGDRAHDLWLVLAALVLNGLIHCTAFLLRPNGSVPR